MGEIEFRVLKGEPSLLQFNSQLANCQEAVAALR